MLATAQAAAENRTNSMVPLVSISSEDALPLERSPDGWSATEETETADNRGDFLEENSHLRMELDRSQQKIKNLEDVRNVGICSFFNEMKLCLLQR